MRKTTHRVTVTDYGHYTLCGLDPTKEWTGNVNDKITCKTCKKIEKKKTSS